MSIKVLSGFVLFLLISACAGLHVTNSGWSTGGGKPPVITQSFASKQLAPGDTWKVYLNALDMDGDMKFVVCTISQKGVGESVSYTRIKKDNGKELSGYVYLNTFSSPDYQSLDFTNLTLTLQVKDQAGNLGTPQVFPLSFNARFTQEVAPPGVFKDQDLGAVMVTLHNPFTEF